MIELHSDLGPYNMLYQAVAPCISPPQLLYIIMIASILSKHQFARNQKTRVVILLKLQKFK